MSKAFFTVNRILIIFLISVIFFSADGRAAETKPAIVITSQTLTADSKNNIVIFEGRVVAKKEDITIHSDKMKVYYNNSLGEIKKIYAYGDVKAFKDERAIFSEEATYLGEDERIVFRGKPKAVDGKNIITGTEIIYFIRENRTIVKDSRVVLKKEQGIGNALSPN